MSNLLDMVENLKEEYKHRFKGVIQKRSKYKKSRQQTYYIVNHLIHLFHHSGLKYINTIKTTKNHPYYKLFLYVLYYTLANIIVLEIVLSFFNLR